MSPARATFALVSHRMDALSIDLSPVERLGKIDAGAKSVLEHRQKSILIELLMQSEILPKLLVSLTSEHLILLLNMKSHS